MSEAKEKEEEKPVVAKTAVDLQRLKLLKLMKNPEKPVILPERPKAKNTPTVPEFVRNVMGSSAGAGSGEFHVYRHLRRKEYARQKFIQEKGRKELLDAEYHLKLEENRKIADETTAKKRAKRLKKKQKWKQRKRSKSAMMSKEDVQNTEESSDEEEEAQDEQDVSDDRVTESETVGSSMAKEDNVQSINGVEQSECSGSKNDECVPQGEMLTNECTKQEEPYDIYKDNNRNVENVQTQSTETSTDGQSHSTDET